MTNATQPSNTNAPKPDQMHDVKEPNQPEKKEDYKGNNPGGPESQQKKPV